MKRRTSVSAGGRTKPAAALGAALALALVATVAARAAGAADPPLPQPEGSTTTVEATADPSDATGSAPAGQPGAALSVSPATAPVFTWVTVSGTGCIGPAPRAQVSLTDGFQPFRNWGLIGMSASGTPAPDGTWEFAFKVNPLLSSTETYVWTARCIPDISEYLPPDYQPDRWSYSDAPFQVTNGPQAAWAITAGPGPAELTATGYGCVESGAMVTVYLRGTTERNYDSGFGGGTGTVRPDGSWTVPVRITTDSIAYRPGMPLSAQAECSTPGSGFFLFYPPTTVSSPSDTRRAPSQSANLPATS